MIKQAKWIASPTPSDVAADFQKGVSLTKPVKKATLSVTSMGNYVAKINGTRVTDAVLTPGWTTYKRRVQYQTYDVTALLSDENRISVSVGNAWAVGTIGIGGNRYYYKNTSLIASLDVTYADGSKEVIISDTDWEVFTSSVLYSDIYNGEIYDTTAPIEPVGNAVLSDVTTKLVPQVGEWIREQERLSPVEIIRTPKGETVIDFGQNMTGYVEIQMQAPRGARIVLHHGEVLDRDGNFYNANLRSAKSEAVYVCSGGEDVFKPLYTFYGFRYVHLVEYPFETVDPNLFRAVVVHSDMKRTGHFRCGNEKINQLYHNIVWGQKSNYLDVPTDCPQRDERLGWTGDTQVFCRTGAINYDVEKFFKKWMGDVALDQRPDGGIPHVVPYCFRSPIKASAAWADAACVVPWEIYLAYGNKALLKQNFPMMKKWVEYMHNDGPEEFLWLGGDHFGDWLAMDHGEDSYVGATSTDLIGSAYFAYSTSLLIKAGHVLGYDMTEYETLYRNVVAAFRKHYLPNGELMQYSDLFEKGQKNPPCETQTAYVLILYFGLCEECDRRRLADRLAGMIRENGTRMTTGFVGTPYLLHALTENGHTDLAYDLLFQEKTPSWLYSVNHGATTMWEHWNSLKEDGSFWSTNMNSFNHYAYSAVFDWIFGKAMGINTVADAPAYREITLAPHPDRRLGFAETSINSRNGTVRSHWYYKGDVVYYEFDIPAGVTAHLTLPSGYSETLTGGTYHFAESAF
ncbi:MAG: family 78 glycoside hydrolase catalytic domain [Clostridia bacterium]|nr:family 78 glycoside hydrolase catalytic domain [Clostridia bacterium]